MVRTLQVTLAVVVAAAVTHAQTPDAEDPRTAMEERGIVLKASKRHYVVIIPMRQLPSEAPQDSTLYKATIYFGDSKRLVRVNTDSWMSRPGGEETGIIDARVLYSAILKRSGDSYELRCAATFDGSSAYSTKLTPTDTTLLQKALVQPSPLMYQAYLLTRMSGTSYLYVDRRGTEGTDYRLFIGKRGAMKRVPIKEITDDHEALILVTAKGTLTVTKSNAHTATTATFGSAKKPAALSLLSAHQNRKLIYRDLGVYTREATNHPCYEL